VYHWLVIYTFVQISYDVILPLPNHIISEKALNGYIFVFLRINYITVLLLTFIFQDTVKISTLNHYLD